MANIVPNMADLAAKINAEHAQAETAWRAGLEHARKAGELLIEAKEQCRHSEWLPWLKENVRFSERTAQAYMQVVKRWDELEAKAQGLADLTFQEGLKLLAAPAKKEFTLEESEEIFQRAVQASNECVAEMTRFLADPNSTISDCLFIRDAASKLGAEWKAMQVRNANRLREVLGNMSEEDRLQLSPDVREQIRRLPAIID